MTSIEFYRLNAEECLRKVADDKAEHDKPLWATLARSWLQLAEHAARMSEVIEAEAREEALEAADEAPARS